MTQSPCVIETQRNGSGCVHPPQGTRHPPPDGVQEAVELAEEGQATDGYTALLAGLSRAREVVEDGEPRGEELFRRWEAAVANDAARHGIGRA